MNDRNFIDDNNTVYRLLCDLLIGTAGFVWVEQYDRSQNGRDAWMVWVEHYEGGGQCEKHKSSALATLRSLHYKNESVFSFEDFSRKLVRAYRNLEGTEEAYTPYNKVQTFLTKIEISLPRVEVAKAHVHANHLDLTSMPPSPTSAPNLPKLLPTPCPSDADAHRFMTEFRQPLQVHSHLEMPRLLVQLGHIQRT